MSGCDKYAMYVKIKEYNDNIIVCQYVDNLIFTKNNPKIFRDFKQPMIREFEMTNIGLMTYYSRIEMK